MSLQAASIGTPLCICYISVMYNTYPGNPERTDEQGWRIQDADSQLAENVSRGSERGLISPRKIEDKLARMRPPTGKLTLVGQHRYTAAAPVVSLLQSVQRADRGDIPVDLPPDRSRQYVTASFTGPITPEYLGRYLEQVNEASVLSGSSAEVPYLQVSSDPTLPISIGMMNPTTGVRTEMPLPSSGQHNHPEY